MRLIFSDFKKGIARIKVDNLDDLWYLSGIVDEGDIVKARTVRKIKLGKDDSRASNIVKKPVTLSIKADKIEFHKYSGSLRMGGAVVEGPEDVPKGSHHTFDVTENTVLTIIKPRWLGFQIGRLKESVQNRPAKVIICILDRDEACFALLKDYGYDYLGELAGEVQKKAVEDKGIKEGEFYGKVIAALEDYVKRYSAGYVIIASPAFWKEDMMKALKKKNNELAEKVTLATCNAFGKNAINEVLKRDEVRSVLKHDRVVRETNYVEELFRGIAKKEPAEYGLKYVKEAAEAGAVRMLLLTDSLIRDMRQEGSYNELEYVMRLVDQKKGEVHIISADNDAGSRLNGLGGIGAILRYKIRY